MVLVDYLAVLNVRDPPVIKRYAERQMIPYEHTWQIRKVFGYRDFGDERASRWSWCQAAAERMHRTLAEATAGADGELPYRLVELLRVAGSARVSELERLRRTSTSAGRP